MEMIIEQFFELDGILRMLIVLAATFILTLIVKLLFGVRLRKKRATTIVGMIGSILMFLIWFAGIVYALMQIGVDTTSILVGAGITGVILGLGSESIIADVLAGIFLIMDKDIQVGDTIALDDFRGEVVSMGIRTVSIRDVAGNVNIIRNSSIESVINQSKNNTLAVVRFPLSREEKMDEVDALVNKAVDRVYKEYPDMFLSKPVYRGIDELSTELTDEWMTLLVTAEVKEKDIYDAKRAILRAVKVAFEPEEIDNKDEEHVLEEAE